jgi:hypothetical protein
MLADRYIGGVLAVELCDSQAFERINSEVVVFHQENVGWLHYQTLPEDTFHCLLIPRLNLDEQMYTFESAA